jgi:hypothetical protein
MSGSMNVLDIRVEWSDLLPNYNSSETQRSLENCGNVTLPVNSGFSAAHSFNLILTWEIINSINFAFKKFKIETWIL